jgi:hypothetical protein
MLRDFSKLFRKTEGYGTPLNLCKYKSSIEICTKDVIKNDPSSLQRNLMIKNSNEKNEKKMESENEETGDFSITLWNSSKTQKVFEFLCPSEDLKRKTRENLEKELDQNEGKDLKTKDDAKEIANIRIKIKENQDGKRSFDFVFKSLNGSCLDMNNLVNCFHLKGTLF